MSCSIEPGRTFDVVLPEHADDPQPLTFVARAASARQSLAVLGAIREIAGGDIIDGSRKLADAVTPLLVDWRNAKTDAGEDVPFAVDKVLDLLTLRQYVQLATSVAGRLEAAERKKSE